MQILPCRAQWGPDWFDEYENDFHNRPHGLGGVTPHLSELHVGFFRFLMIKVI